METHDHHPEHSPAHLGPVKALRYASPRARAAGLTWPRSSRVGLSRDGRHVVRSHAGDAPI